MTTTADSRQSRRTTFLHGLAFVFGFGFIFVLGGAAVGAIGALVQNYDVRIFIARFGGVIIILFGLHTMGLIRIPFLDYDTRRQVKPNPRWGYFSSIMMGIFFSAGWAPCVGPVLSAVYTLVLVGGRALDGAILLAAYSTGMAIPFLLAALSVGSVMVFFRRHTKVVRYMSIITGILLILLGIMLFTGTLGRLAELVPILPGAQLEDLLVN
jgi:cytochrome c-type biogenesis protein